MKQGMLALVAAGLLAGCGAGNSGSVLDAQSKQLHRNTKTTVAADYEGAVQSLYIAYFGRPADPVGLANFEVALAADNAPTTVPELALAYATDPALRTLIDGFGTSRESQNLYAGADSQAFVTAVFQHVLGRAPATTGLDYWSNAIDTGAVSQGDAALAIMGGALQNTSTQGLLDAQLIGNRITAAEYFTTTVNAESLTAAYAGATAAGDARTMLSLVNESTNLNSFQTQEDNTISGLTISGATSAYTGAALVTFNGGSSTVYDAAGNPFGIDASSYGIVSTANNVYLSGLGVDATNADWYVVKGGNIIGFLAYVTGSNNTGAIGFYYTGNNYMGQMQIDASSSAWSAGCGSACVSNTNSSPTPVALQEIDTTLGAGAMATLGKTVTVTYTGWLYDVNAANFKGTMFDSSSLHGGSFSFTLGAGKVIGGWDIGVQGMQVGGVRTLIIPSILGYGSTANGNIPANSGLVFTVQLLSVQ
ncbi:MAG: FKBP-type peptidyl-prolyl cis-trans isomerase [Burkholderiaceae bacterium]|nr:FKBP-type peptidyl-prolyl cis-trans isomerase [Burkholderiaceae bacterium]